MSKHNQIENALKEIDGAKFHRLCNAYLSGEGYKNLTSPGLSPGKDKSTTGTPDTLISLPNGRYIFVEITTKQEGAKGKFEDDIKKCFNENKTSIPVSKIDKIMLCYNLELTTHEIESLNTLCENNGCAFEVIGLSTLSNNLFGRYPQLAKEFLGVEIDTGQVLTPERFVEIYGANRLTTPLDTPFFGREQELEQIKEELAKDDVLVLSGRPGAGKTRIALEAIEQYGQENPQFQSKCIHFHGEPIYDDIKSYFSASGSYIILVDDANRLGALESFLYLIQDKRPNRRVKLILTVRDYALSQVIEKVRMVSECIPVEISSFNSEQLNKMLGEKFNILNAHYQMRIWNISRGNLRLAVMCAKIALDSDSLQSLNDVSDLFRKYYESIRNELSEMGNDTLLRVASIVAFFRVVDTTESDQMSRIRTLFGIDENEFVEKVKQLDRLEILDFYENQIVKVSDQVLGTYLLYLAFIEERILKIDPMIRECFAGHQALFTEAINPLRENFSDEVIRKTLAQSMSKLWKEWLPLQSYEVQCQFLSAFWYVDETETIDFTEKIVASLAIDETETTEDAETRYWTQDTLPNILATLLFDSSQFVITGHLIVDYLRKKPISQKLFMGLLTDNWKSPPQNSADGYSRENTLVTLFWQNCANGSSEAITHIFIALAKKYLNILSQEWETFHSELWDKLLSLYPITEYKASIRDLLTNYFSHFSEIKHAGFLELDTQKLLPFMYSRLEPENYAECLLFHKIIKGCRTNKIKYDTAQEKRFHSKIWRMGELLIYDQDEIVHDYDRYKTKHER